MLLARVARPCALEAASPELGGRAASYLLCVGRWRQIKDGRRRNSQEWCRRKGKVPAGYDDYVRNKGKGNDVGNHIKGKGIVGIKGTRRPLATPVVGDDIVQVAVYGNGKVGHAKIINKGYEGVNKGMNKGNDGGENSQGKVPDDIKGNGNDRGREHQGQGRSSAQKAKGARRRSAQVRRAP